MEDTLLDHLLIPIGCLHDRHFRGYLSVIFTALKRDQPILISHSDTIPTSTLIHFLEYIFTSLCPLTLSVIDKSGRSTFPGSKSSHKRSHHRQSRLRSPFLANICILDSIQETEHPEEILQVIREGVVIIDDEELFVPKPSLIIALIPQATHLPKTLATAFTFHINISEFPIDCEFPAVERPFSETFDELIATVRGQSTGPAFMHKEVSIYLGKLFCELIARH